MGSTSGADSSRPMATGAKPAQGDSSARAPRWRRRARLVAGIAHGAAQRASMAASPPGRGELTRADSVARLTVASCTPGTLRSARSTRPTQLAQVMPPMPGPARAAQEGKWFREVFMGSTVILAIMARSSAE
jgi:hypothetical protein